jgi:hypothetical protein
MPTVLLGAVSGDRGETRMEWYEGRPQLRLTGHRSAELIEGVFESSMVDVAYVIEATDDSVSIVADDPKWPKDAADYQWLCSVIKGTLADNGISGVELSLVPTIRTPPD